MRIGQSESRGTVHAQLLRVGAEVFPVYGDEVAGFSVSPDDFRPNIPGECRYDSLDELFFALVNLHIAHETQA